MGAERASSRHGGPWAPGRPQGQKPGCRWERPPGSGAPVCRGAVPPATRRGFGQGQWLPCSTGTCPSSLEPWDAPTTTESVWRVCVGEHVSVRVREHTCGELQARSGSPAVKPPPSCVGSTLPPTVQAPGAPPPTGSAGHTRLKNEGGLWAQVGQHSLHAWDANSQPTQLY